MGVLGDFWNAGVGFGKAILKLCMTPAFLIMVAAIAAIVLVKSLVGG